MKKPGIITLITDFGMSDPYVGMMKGVILAINRDAQLIDLTHQVELGSIFQAAGYLRETFLYFPEGTIHMAVVDPGVGSGRRLLAMEAKGHFFVGPDNGIFWPIIEDFTPRQIVQLTQEKYFLPHMTQTFHGRDVFAPVAAHLSLGVSLENMGPPMGDPVKLNYPTPKTINDILYGQIIRVDHFGNLITNIRRADLEGFLKSAKPLIQTVNFTIRKLSKTYADIEEGEPLALINSSDQLEVAVNLGRASQYIKIASGDIVGTQIKVRRE